MTIGNISQNQFNYGIPDGAHEPIAPPKTQSVVTPQQFATTIDEPAQQPLSGTPASGARDTTTPAKSGYAEFREALEARLAEDPDYQAAVSKLNTWGNLEFDFAVIDRFTGLFTNNNEITYGDLLALANDPFCPDPGAKAAAERLLQNPAIWNEMCGGDNLCTKKEVTDFVAKLKGEVKALKDAASEEVKAELKEKKGAASGGAPAQTGTSGESSAASALPPEGPKPTPSSQSGLDGAMENLGNMASYYDTELAKLTEAIAKDPTNAELNKKFAELTQKKNMIMQLQSQLMQMMQNIAKMWSDVSRNAIQNMR